MIYTRIRIPGDQVPSSEYVETDGYAYLDMPENFSLRESKRITELNSNNKLKFNYSVGFDIDATEKNTVILRKFILATIIDNDYKQLPAEVVVGSLSFDDNEIYVRDADARKISIELRLSLSHWALLSSSIKLRELDYGDPIEMTAENIEQYNIQNYRDGKKGFFFPFFDYGDYRVHEELEYTLVSPVAYLRPWAQLTMLLERGFCAIGYKFESPIMYSDYGRSHYAYLGDKDYGLNYRTSLLNAKASVDVSYTMGFYLEDFRLGRVLFDNIISNDNGNLSADGSIYKGNGIVDVVGNIEFKVRDEETEIEVILAKRSKVDGSILEEIAKHNVKTGSDDQIVKWSFDVKEVPITENDEVSLFIRKNPASPFINILEGTIEYIGVRKYWDTGDELFYNLFVDKEITFLDVVKATTHLFNLKWEYDSRNRVISAYQPYTKNIHTELIEGFFDESDVNDIYLKSDVRNIKSIPPNKNRERYVKIKFKDGDLWSRTVDLGSKYTVDETEELENVLFKPLRSKTDIVSLRTRFNPSEIIQRSSIPYYEEEDKPDFKKDNWDIGQYVGYAFGCVKQEYRDVGSPDHIYGNGDTGNNLIPSISQCPYIKYGEHNQNTVPIRRENAVVFSIPRSEQIGLFPTNYDYFYSRTLKESLLNMTLEVLLDLTIKDYRELSFRSFYLIRHLGRIVKCRAQEIVDFQYGRDILTPGRFIPQRQVSDLCGLVDGEPEEDTSDCQNSPIINWYFDGNDCYVFTLGGNASSPIQSVTWEKRAQGATVWIPNGTGLMSQVCGEIYNFEVRATVVYDEVNGVICRSMSTPIILIEPCPEINYSINCQVSALVPSTTPVVRAFVVSDNPNFPDFTIVSFEWSDSFGPIYNWMPYVEGEDIIGAGTRVFKAVVKYRHCSPVEVYSEDCSIASFPNPCNSIDVGVECVRENGCFTFNLTGTIPMILEYDYDIRYQTSNDGETWSLWQDWDGQPVCTNYVRSKVIVHFCNDQCPTYCSPVVECENCEFIAPVGSNLTACN